MLCIFLGLEKAYDNVHGHSPLFKSQEMGIDGKFLAWTATYLLKRTASAFLLNHLYQFEFPLPS